MISLISKNLLISVLSVLSTSPPQPSKYSLQSRPRHFFSSQNIILCDFDPWFQMSHQWGAPSMHPSCQTLYGFYSNIASYFSRKPVPYFLYGQNSLHKDNRWNFNAPSSIASFSFLRETDQIRTQCPKWALTKLVCNCKRVSSLHSAPLH